MKSARRESGGRYWTIAVCPSDALNPFYIKISLRYITLTLTLLLVLPLYSYLIIKNVGHWSNLNPLYANLQVSNNLQNTKVAIAILQHKNLKDHIHKLKIQEEEIKELLNLNFDEEQSHTVNLYSYPMVSTHKIVSKKGEFGRVLIDNVIVVEYFDNTEKPEAYQRALVTAERIKTILATKAAHKHYVLKKVGGNVFAYINNQLIFVATEKDTVNLTAKISPYDLAKHWLNTIKLSLANQEGQQTLTDRFPILNRDYRRRSSMYRTLYPSIDYPAYTVMLEDENSQKSYKNIDHLLKLAQQEVNTYEKSFAELKNTVEACKVRFEYTPSIYPLSSSFVLSEFGWRNHPIIHRVRFHTGVDLPTWQSAPIFATASGVVTKAGWMAGYGNRVEIDHGYGYSTVYAHNALITVGVGQHIRKGQIIARAGMTGLAQGVHCHYEVRFFDRPVNPDRFLNLTIFTASKNW